MALILHVILFIISILLLTWLNTKLIKNLTKIAKFFGIKEFIIAFFVLGISVSLPNLFVDVGAALRGLPQIAVGDMIGGNLVDLTLVMALAIFFSKKYISADSRMVQGSALFTSFIALFPLIFLFKGSVTRIDGLILIAVFIIYTLWLFSKDDRFKKEYHQKVKITKLQVFIIIFQIIAILILLLFASQEIINATTIFASQLGTSISLVAIIIVGLANCFPEMYLSIVSIRQGKNWLVLGDLMSSVIGAATLVFGVVALVHPFVITDVSQVLVGRIFLIIAAVFFLVFIKSGKKFSKREGLLLLFLYIAFLVTEVFIKI